MNYEQFDTELSSLIERASNGEVPLEHIVGALDIHRRFIISGMLSQAINLKRQKRSKIKIK